MRTASLLTAALSLACACGDDDRPPIPDGGPTYPPASVTPQVAFEGQQRFVAEVTRPGGTDVSTASIEPLDPGGPLEVLDYRCRGTRCGVVLRIRDTQSNRGIPIPSPIDAERVPLRVMTGAGEYRAYVSVFPLDTISNTGTTPLSVGGTVLASSAESIAGSAFQAMDDEPVRWVIFGDASLVGDIDVAPEAGAPRAGGAAGGAASADGAGLFAGAAGAAGAGGGGAGGLEMGEAGEAADRTPGGGGEGGAAGDAVMPECATRFEVLSECGGSGGGGGSGAGGAGGGTLVVVSLGRLTLDAAVLSAAGAPGESGGGGGAGGNLLVAAAEIVGSPTLDVAGGAGGAAPASGGAGGAGSSGYLRVDVSGVAPTGAAVGPAFDVASIASFSDAATLAVVGRAAPGAMVEVRSISDDTMRFEATADATTGAFSVEVTLVPGINRLALYDVTSTIEQRSFTGTNVELEQIPALSQAVPRGGTVDVVYLP